MDHVASRTLWALAETLHAVVYFAPEKTEHYAAAGLKGGWMGYFASRAAALGPVGPEVVAATFYNFNPSMVARAIPDAWRYSTPDRVLRARNAAVSAALHRMVGEDTGVREASVIAGRALEHANGSGRTLFAAHAGLPWPEDPLLALWHACTLWREYRGDAHVAALVAEGIDGCEAHVLVAAAGAAPGDMLRSFRGWSDDDWNAAVGRLRERALLDAAGAPTETGIEARTRVEGITDERSIGPWRAVGDEDTLRFVELLRPIVRGIVDGGGIDFPNPMGLPLTDVEEALS